MTIRAAVLAAFLFACSAPLAAESARDILTSAAFTPSGKAAALSRVEAALKSADAAVARNPRDQDARLQQALAMSYRGKLKRSRSDLVASRQGFEAAVAADPRNAEAQLALACWHLGAVIELGPMMARTMLGARKATGNQALDKALVLGGGNAAVPALASLHRIQLDPADVAGARRLAEAAVAADATTPLDRVMQRQAATLLASLRKGNGKTSAAVAKLLLPFGRLR